MYGGGGVNIVGRGGPVLKDLWPRVYDPLCKISNTLKISFTYEVLSARLEAQIDIKAKKKKGTASVCHFKTSVEKQGIKNISTKLRLFNTKVILVGEIFKNTYISSGLE